MSRKSVTYLVALIVLLSAVGSIAKALLIMGSIPVESEDYHVYGPMPERGFVRITMSGLCRSVEYSPLPIIDLGESCIILAWEPGEYIRAWDPLYNLYTGIGMVLKPIITTYSPEIMRIQEYSQDRVVLVNGTNFGYMVTGVSIYVNESAYLAVVNASAANYTVAFSVSPGNIRTRMVMHLTGTCTVPIHMLSRPVVQIFYATATNTITISFVDENNNCNETSKTLQTKASSLRFEVVLNRTHIVARALNGSSVLLESAYQVGYFGYAIAGIYATAVNGSVELVEWGTWSDWRYARVYPPLATIAYITTIRDQVVVPGVAVYPFAPIGNATIPKRVSAQAYVVSLRKLEYLGTVELTQAQNGLSVTQSLPLSVGWLIAANATSGDGYVVQTGSVAAAGTGCVQFQQPFPAPPLILTSYTGAKVLNYSEYRFCYSTDKPFTWTAIWVGGGLGITHTATNLPTGFIEVGLPVQVGVGDLVLVGPTGTAYLVSVSGSKARIYMASQGNATVLILVRPRTMEYVRADVYSRESRYMPLVRYITTGDWYGFVDISPGESNALVDLDYYSSPTSVIGPIRPTRLSLIGGPVFDAWGMYCASDCAALMYTLRELRDSYLQVWSIVGDTAGDFSGGFICLDDEDKPPSVINSTYVSDYGMYVCVLAMAKRVNSTHILVRASIFDYASGLSKSVDYYLASLAEVVRIGIRLLPDLGEVRIYIDDTEDPTQPSFREAIRITSLYLPELGYIHYGAFGDAGGRVGGASLWVDGAVDNLFLGTNRVAEIRRVVVPQISVRFIPIGEVPPLAYFVMWLGVAISLMHLGRSVSTAVIAGSLAVSIFALLLGDYNVMSLALGIMILMIMLKRSGYI